MKLLLVIFSAALFLGLLWSPAWLAARRRAMRGDRYAFFRLRTIFPCQLLGVVTLAFGADVLGWHNPAGVMVAATVTASMAGAGMVVLAGMLARAQTAAGKIKQGK